MEFHPLVINTDITDHYPIYLDLTLDIVNDFDVTKKVQETPILDENKFISLIGNQSWNMVISSNTPEMAHS